MKLIRPFYYDPVLVDPRKVAQHDEDYHDIESIRDHRFVNPAHQLRSEMSLLVKWNEITQPSWHKWSPDFGKAEVVHQYLKDHNLKKFIHVQYKEPAPK